jgi:hypothetical protein
MGFHPLDTSFVYSQLLVYAELMNRQSGISIDISIPVLTYYILLKSPQGCHSEPCMKEAARIYAMNVAKAQRAEIVKKGDVTDIVDRFYMMQEHLNAAMASHGPSVSEWVLPTVLSLTLFEAGRQLAWPTRDEIKIVSNALMGEPDNTTLFKIFRGLAKTAPDESALWTQASVANIPLFKEVVTTAGAEVCTSLLDILKLNTEGKMKTTPYKTDVSTGTMYLPPLDWTIGNNTTLALWTARRIDKENVKRAEDLLEPSAFEHRLLPHQEALSLRSSEPRLVDVSESGSKA